MISTSIKHSIRLAACIWLIAWTFQDTAHAEMVDTVKSDTTFSMEFRDASIKDVLRAVGQAANMNLVVSETVNGQVSMSLKDVNVWEALEAILKTKGLTYVRTGNIVRVLAVAEARDDDLEMRVFPLGYANGKDILVIADKIKSDKQECPWTRAQTRLWSRTFPLISTAWNGCFRTLTGAAHRY